MISDNLSRLNIYKQLYNDPRFQTALINIFIDVIEFAVRAYQYFGHRAPSTQCIMPSALTCLPIVRTAAATIRNEYDAPSMFLIAILVYYWNIKIPRLSWQLTFKKLGGMDLG